jgi:hypothetical protein
MPLRVWAGCVLSGVVMLAPVSFAQGNVPRTVLFKPDSAPAFHLKDLKGKN